MAHEVAHSLGLADPEGAGFHNEFDGPGHIMDAAPDRSFAERAQLNGKGPTFFCTENYQYLRDILPTASSDPMARRSDCF